MLKGEIAAISWRKTQERRSLWAPPPCAMSASRPFGTISQLRETLRSLVTRSASQSPVKRRRNRPRSLFNVALLRRGFRLGRAEANRRGICGAKCPDDTTLRHAAMPSDRGTSRSLNPSAFSRPWQRTTLGLPALWTTRPLPRAAGFLRRRLPQPVRPRGQHTSAWMRRTGDERLIPVIHRTRRGFACRTRLIK